MTGIYGAFHEPQGFWYHGGALLYGVGGYVLGLAGLFSGSPWINAGAGLLLGHAMTICAYLIHECGQNTVFRSNDANARLGRFLNWICGYLAHPDAHYFAVVRLGRDQDADYARRKAISLHEAEGWLAPNLGYEPAAVAAPALRAR